MTASMAQRHRLAILGWLATVAVSLSLYPAFRRRSATSSSAPA